MNVSDIADLEYDVRLAPIRNDYDDSEELATIEENFPLVKIFSFQYWCRGRLT